MKIKDLTKEQLWQLRQQIILCSLFIRDYKNSFGIDEEECYTFFDGYVDYLSEIALEGLNILKINYDEYWELVFKQDNADNLYNWLSCIE